MAPSFDNVAASSTVTGRVSEVQSITVNTSDGLIFGGFNLDFNNSGISLYFRADESAKDMEYKLESLPTVGDVSVTRSTRVHNSNILAGYEWLVTFNSDEGDLPLLQFDNTPANGTDLLASQGQLYLSGTIHEVTKGAFLSVLEEFTGLTPKPVFCEYVRLQCGRRWRFHADCPERWRGCYASDLQPLRRAIRSRDRPVTPLSASQLEVDYSFSADTGGDLIEKYLVEYTANTSVDAWSINGEYYLQLGYRR